MDYKNSNAGDTLSDKTMSLLMRKISYLRFFVYLFLATSVLLSLVILLWISYAYQQSTIETFYSQAPQPVKASLHLSPPGGSYKVGDEFTVNILVNTAGSNVVATAAYLSFNKETMKAVSLDTSNSVFDMVAEKDINGKDGKIKVTIGRPTPGVNTYDGMVASIKFKALQKVSPLTENIYFDFTKGSSLYSGVFLDDKKGTNILSATRGAKIFIE